MVDVTQNEDKLNLLLQYLSEIIQVNVSIWRIIYALAEIFALVLVGMILPVWILKSLAWGIKNAINLFKNKD